MCYCYLATILVVGTQRAVPGEGMPTYRMPFEKGNLFIKFEVTFPPDGFINENEAKVWILTILFKDLN
jgi:DnaJ homolog subfamily A member 2